MPFFMKDVFCDLSKLKHDVESGRLKFIRTESVQDFIRSMTEYSLTPRGRVSVKSNFRGIEEAIQRSSSLIDSLCEKDREYEALMERYPFG